MTAQDAKGIKGSVFDIERYATEDGPGIRTAVFFKGCPLRCPWCANPESQRKEPEIMYYRSLCSGCGSCLKNCPHKAILASEDFGLVTDNSRCAGCGLCVKNCLYDARKRSGSMLSAGEVLETVLKDAIYYETSGGGVTFSGGEPMMQPDFLEALLLLSKESGLNTALETCGMPGAWEKVLPMLDLVYADVKHVDRGKFSAHVGADITPFLETIRSICARHQNVAIRVPCIPDFNQTEEDMRQIFAFIRELQPEVPRVELLPYHRLGRDKYKSLGRTYAMEAYEQLDPKALAGFAAMAREMGLHAAIGPA